MGGGSKTQVVTPTPAAQPSTADAVNAYVASLPTMFQAQLDYAPKEAAQQVELAQQFAGPLGLALKQAQESLYPTQTGLTEALAKQAVAQMETPVSEAEQRFIRSNINADLGTNVRSGVGNVFKAKTFSNIYNQRLNEARQVAATTAGLGNLGFNAQMPNYTNQMGQYNPSSVMNFMGNTYGAYTSAARPMQLAGGGGTDTGAMIGGIGSAIGGIAMVA